MMKILKTLSLIAGVAAIAGGATYAYFSAQTTSGANAFTAGTMNLQLGSDRQGYATQGITFGADSEMAPGGPASGPYRIYFKNTGTIPGNVKVKVSYESHGTTEADNVAKYMVISSAKLDDNSMFNNRQAYWAEQVMTAGGYSNEADAISAGKIVRLGTGTIPVGDGSPKQNLAPTLFGLSNIYLYVGPDASGNDVVWNKGDVHFEDIALMLDKSADNNVQGKGVNVTVEATMKQVADTTHGGALHW